RKNEFEWTIKIAEKLLGDKHDLIHKAVGWMLREMGKRDENQLIKFLEKYATQMPRTMLRYSIEKLNVEQKIIYLHKKS
ncbi:MAG TPA: DNA alkylation repair protein, partial [Legionellaceae bacterium]|nr:DNA alkylation repair protein [Legionellaceae bacterium]